MAYNYITQYDSPNYTAGRQGNNISSITIHWWGDPSQNPSFEGVTAWLCNPAAQVSAHYVVTGTDRRVACIVDPSNIAWHAGNWVGNQTSIGIECDPRCRDEDYDVIAELVAELRKTYGDLPLRPHNSWTSTSCPGNYDLGRIDRMAREKAGQVVQRDRTDEINYLNGLYQQILDRNVDENAIGHYLSQIDKGWNWDQIREDLANSAEGKAVAERRNARNNELRAAYDSETNEIQRLYKEILERDADADGTEHYRNQIRSGWNWQMVEDDLRRSDEYKELQRIKNAPTPEIQHVEPEPPTQPEEKPQERAAETPQEAPKAEDATTILGDIRRILQAILDAITGLFKK